MTDTKPGRSCTLIRIDDFWRQRLHDERTAKDASERVYGLLTVYDRAEGEDCKYIEVTGADEMAAEVTNRYEDPDALEVSLYRLHPEESAKCA